MVAGMARATGAIFLRARKLKPLNYYEQIVRMNGKADKACPEHGRRGPVPPGIAGSPGPWQALVWQVGQGVCAFEIGFDWVCFE